MPRKSIMAIAICFGLSTHWMPTVDAQPVAATTDVPSPFSYADIADLAVATPMVIDVRVRRTTAIPAVRATGVAPGMARLLVEGDVQALIRGSGPLAARITWLADLPTDARGRTERLNRQRLLIFAQPVRTANGAPTTGAVQLVAPDAMLRWDAGTDRLTRSILAEAVARDAPPAITGVSSGFHQAGSLPGESETQLFLDTANGEPAALQIIRSPGTPARWAVSFGEIVDAASVPAAGTLGWYRLACGLPRTLPPGGLAGASAAENQAAAADYALVLRALGPCTRTRTTAGATGVFNRR